MAFPESLDMLKNEGEVQLAQPGPQDHRSSCSYSVNYELVLRILYRTKQDPRLFYPSRFKL